MMEISIIFKIAALGIVITVLGQVFKTQWKGGNDFPA